MLEGGDNYQRVRAVASEEDGRAAVALPFGSLPSEVVALKLEVREGLRQCLVQFVAVGMPDLGWTPSAVQAEQRAALNELPTVSALVKAFWRQLEEAPKASADAAMTARSRLRMSAEFAKV